MKIGYVYKLVCKDINVKEIYIGSTVNINQRRRQHKNCCNKTTNPDHNIHVYEYIRENGGWDNWDSIVVEQFEFNEKHELRARERFHLEDLKATLNKTIPTRTQTEYREVNKDKYTLYKKQYYEDNKESIAERNKTYVNNNMEKTVAYRKQYYADNKEEVVIQHKQYYENNKERLAECGKIYRETNKERIKERLKTKYVCECGSSTILNHKVRHLNSKKHLDYIKNK